MPTLVLEHDDDVPSGLCGEVLRNHGHKLHSIRLHRGDALPQDLDDVTGIVVCGGEPSVVQSPPEWIPDEMEYLKRAHDERVPIVAICFGSQVLAQALGGACGVVEGGIELGWYPVTLTRAGQWDTVHAGIGWTTVQFHWHRDQVTELPPGAQLLASSQQCKVQSWSLGPTTYAFQYHAEVTPAIIDRWIETSPDGLELAGISAAALRDQTEEQIGEMTRLSLRLFERIALLVMPQDRRFAGLAKEIHH